MAAGADRAPPHVLRPLAVPTRRPSFAMIRAAGRTDLPVITRIYAHHVRTGLASFEIEPPDLVEMQRRFDAIVAAGYPYLVAQHDEVVLGYAYANIYRARPAYRHTVEDSIYLAPEAIGKGLGRTLLDSLCAACESCGYHQMLAVIGDSANAASIGVHRACGFREVGMLRAVGYKFDRWVDSVLMQRALGPGDAAPPTRGPIDHPNG
jgi:phosphinothricin acetyltransferase